jgi:hypothetical protein
MEPPSLQIGFIFEQLQRQPAIIEHKSGPGRHIVLANKKKQQNSGLGARIKISEKSLKCPLRGSGTNLALPQNEHLKSRRFESCNPSGITFLIPSQLRSPIFAIGLWPRSEFAAVMTVPEAAMYENGPSL